MRHIVETYADVGEAPRRLIAVGGGTRNAVWCGAVSDVAGAAQIIRTVSTGASFGDAFLAAVATGHAQLSDIETWNPTACVQAPAGGAVKAVYDRLYPVYRALYTQTRGLMAALSS